MAADSWVGSVIRFVYSESGRDAYNRIRTIFHEAMRLYNSSLEEHKIALYERIVQANGGLDNLIQTYQSTPDVRDNLKVLSEEVNLWIIKNKKGL